MPSFTMIAGDLTSVFGTPAAGYYPAGPIGSIDGEPFPSNPILALYQIGVGPVALFFSGDLSSRVGSHVWIDGIDYGAGDAGTQWDYSGDIDATVWGIESGPEIVPDGSYSFDIRLEGALEAPLVTNASEFFPAVLTTLKALSAPLLTNSNTFYPPIVAQDGTLYTELLTNASTIFAPSVSSGKVLNPGLLTNASVFYAAVVARQGAPWIKATKQDEMWTPRTTQGEVWTVKAVEPESWH